MPPVYLIGLMGVDISHEDKKYWRERYISEYTFLERGCHELLDDTIFIIFAELTRFNKTEDECESDLDRLLYLLKNSKYLVRPPKWVDERCCKGILDAFEINEFDPEKRKKYEQDMCDEVSAI